MSEWFFGIDYEAQLVTWLVASFLLYVIAVQLAWQLRWYTLDASSTADAQGQDHDAGRYRAPEDTFGGSFDRLWRVLFTPWMEEVLRFAYYLGIPFLAAVSGLLGADVLGISGTDWVNGQNIQGFLREDWLQGAGFAAGVFLAMVGVWSAGRLLSRRAALRPVTLAFIGPVWQRLLHVLYDQVHWAFYRSGPILWLGDLYWGSLVGLALVLFEAALNPALWWALKSPETAGPPLFRLGMAWVSALLFVATQNLWLTLAVHLLLAVLLGGIGSRQYASVDSLAE